MDTMFRINIWSIIRILCNSLEKSVENMCLKFRGNLKIIVKIMLQANFIYLVQSGGYIFHNIACEFYLTIFKSANQKPYL